MMGKNKISWTWACHNLSASRRPAYLYFHFDLSPPMVENKGRPEKIMGGSERNAGLLLTTSHHIFFHGSGCPAYPFSRQAFIRKRKMKSRNSKCRMTIASLFAIRFSLEATVILIFLEFGDFLLFLNELCQAQPSSFQATCSDFSWPWFLFFPKK